jgi:GT2 family glycosyltransferase
MIAIVIPTWHRIEFTEICLKSFIKYTNFDIVTKFKVFDNSSGVEMKDLLESLDVDYEVGEFNGAWAGFNKFLGEVNNDKSIKYIGKVDNDVYFTKPWIEPIIDEFNKDETIGSIRYGWSNSKGKTSPFTKNRGFNGGLKIIKKQLAIPILEDQRYTGSNGISKNVINQGFTTSSMEVGVHMLDLLYPDLESKYKGMGIQRPNTGS